MRGMNVLMRGMRIGRGRARIVSADCGSTDQARARADGSTCAGIAGGSANGRAQRRTTQGAEDGAVGLFMVGGLARRDVAGARRGIAAAEKIARPLILCGLGRAGRRTGIGAPRSECTTVPAGERSATALRSADTARPAVIRESME